jgi:DNA-binding transcriptional LysR family regulator
MAETARRRATQAHERTTGRLAVGYLAGALPPVVPRMLRNFALSAPGIELELRDGSARELIEDVRAGRLDATVACLPAPVAGLCQTPLGNEAAVAALPESHPCARDPELDVRALERTPMIVHARRTNPAFYDAVLGAWSAAGVAPAIIELDEPAIEQTLLAVAANAGIAVLPESAAQRYAAPGVRFVSLTPPVPSCEVALLTRRDEARTAVASLVHAAREAARPRPALRAAA